MIKFASLKKSGHFVLLKLYLKKKKSLFNLVHYNLSLNLSQPLVHLFLVDLKLVEMLL